MLDSNSFKVTVKLAEGFTSVTPEPEVQLAFQGVGSHSLTPWVVKPGQRFHYKLPALVDPDEVEVSLGVDRQGSQLANCDCYEYRGGSHRLSLKLPSDWPEDAASETLLVFLSHGTESSIYHVPVTVVFSRARISRTQGPSVRASKATREILSSVWADSPDFTELEGEIDLSGSARREVDPAQCLPIYAKTDSAGHINLMFNHPIALKVDKEDLMAEVLNSGAIQV